MISLSRVNMSVNSKHLLRNISLETTGKSLLLGPNGSGKTTLLRVLSGLYNFEGSVGFNGRDLKTSDRLTFVSCNLPDAYKFAVYFDDCARILAEVKGLDTRLLGQLLSESGVEVAHKRIASLSQAERAIALTALAVSSQPQVILIDEPFENLDRKRKGVVTRWLRDYGNEGIVVTHEQELIASFQDWPAYLMLEGAVYGPFEPARLLHSKIVAGEAKDAFARLEIREKPYSLVDSHDGSSLNITSIYDYV